MGLGVKIYTVFHKGTRVYSDSHNKFLNFYCAREWTKGRALAVDLKSHMSFLSDYYDMMVERIDDLEKTDPGLGWIAFFHANSK
jgi:hypothetical protein